MQNKMVVDGKIVDLSKATKIAETSYSNPGDVFYCHQELYVTNKGNYVLVGEGGPKSAYGHAIGTNEVAGGSGASIISQEEAAKIAADWQTDADIMIKFFGDLLEEA